MGKITATVKDCAILHNGEHYEIGSTIELDETEAANISLYLDNVQAVGNGEENATTTTTTKDTAISEADVAAAEANIAAAESAKKTKK